MKAQSTLLSTAILLLAAALAAPAAAQCQPDGDVRFLCGPPSPEDLLAVPGTPWVIVSSRISDDDGYLITADTRDLSTTTIYSASTLSATPDRQAYAACPGPPPSTFQPHGIALRQGQADSHTLYVVAHGARESVEVFRLDASGAVPSTTWVGCVVAPDGVSLNSVAPLPGGSIVVTNFNVAEGELWEWSPSRGWSEVPGSTMRGPNGVVASPDGRWLYVGGWGEEALVRLSRGATPVERSAAPTGFHIDNVRWAPDGSLLVAGQYGSATASIGACLNGGSCDGVASRAARVHPETLAVEQLVDYPSNELFIFGTVAIEVGDELWFGGIAGAERIARFPL